MIKMTKTTDPEPDGEARRRSAETFVSKTLRVFAELRASRPKPITDRTGGKTRTAEWRLFVNRFFFIERGRIENEPDYMALVSVRSTGETELAFANINLRDNWRVLSSDTKVWGENWFEDVEPTEEAVISSMAAFLFHAHYIVAETSEPEDGESED